MLSYIVKMFKALNANAHPGEIAHAFACGMLLGFLPKSSVLWYAFFIIFLFIRMNKGAFFLTILLGSLFAPLLDPLFDTIGYAFLTLPELQDIFMSLLDIPFVVYTQFNNTIVSGSIIFSLLGYIPFYVFMRLFVKLWRKTLQPMIMNCPITKAFLKLPLIRTLTETAKKIESL